MVGVIVLVKNLMFNGQSYPHPGICTQMWTLVEPSHWICAVTLWGNDSDTKMGAVHVFRTEAGADAWIAANGGCAAYVRP